MGNTTGPCAGEKGVAMKACAFCGKKIRNGVAIVKNKKNSHQVLHVACLEIIKEINKERAKRMAMETPIKLEKESKVG